jgi:hypothetical protein
MRIRQFIRLYNNRHELAINYQADRKYFVKSPLVVLQISFVTIFSVSQWVPKPEMLKPIPRQVLT